MLSKQLVDYINVKFPRPWTSNFGTIVLTNNTKVITRFGSSDESTKKGNELAKSSKDLKVDNTQVIFQPSKNVLFLLYFDGLETLIPILIKTRTTNP
jgi:hypothetical protein